MIGIMETVTIVLAIAFLVFWLGKKSPELARNAGRSIAEFKQGMKDLPVEIQGIKEEINKQ